MVYYGIQRTEGTGGTEEIINEINEFYTESGMPTINVIESYNSWYANYRLASKEDVTRFTELLQIFNDIDNIDLKDLKYSPIRYTYITRLIHPLIRIDVDLLTPTKEDGLEIFNNAIPSYNVPYIQYNSTSNDIKETYDLDLGNRYKIYQGDSSQPVPLDLVILSKNDTKGIHTLYMTIWIGKNLSKLTKEYYIAAEYNLVNNELSFSVPLKDPDTDKLILSRLEQCLNIQINPSEMQDLTVGAEFLIYNEFVYHTLFAYAIFSDKIYSKFIYFDEKDKPISLKKVKRLRYQSLEDQGVSESVENSAWITFHNVTVESPEVHLSSKGESINLEANSNYIRVLLVKVKDKNIVIEFYNLFLRLLKYYLTNKLKYISEINEYFPIVQEKQELDATTKLEATKSSVESKGLINIGGIKLKEMGQGLISSNYKRKCQCNQQPKIIDQADVSAWSQQAF
ncbi:MAG TPA: hypothetical protein VKR58_11685, partial [Aquella sp.]|nr:hypothetical protein [Aquella sp.]